MEKQKKYLKVIDLIWLLLKILFTKGNEDIYYHCIHEAGSYDCPFNVEGVEIRKAPGGDKVTIW